MKKKIIIAVVAVLVIVGGIVAYMAMTGGEVSAEDTKQAEETDKAVENVLDNAEEIEMPTSNPTTDSIESAVELEEFDPNDI